MAIESSPGSSIDLPASDAAGAPQPKPAKSPEQKKPTGKPIANGGKPTAKAPGGDAQTLPAKKTIAAKEITGKEGPTRQTTAKTIEKEKTAASKPPAKQRSSTREELEELEKVGALGMMTLVPAWMISAIVHMVILLIFGIMVMPDKKKDELKALVANVGEVVDGVDNVPDIVPELETEVATDLSSTVDVMSTSEALTPSEINDTPAAATEMTISDVGIATAPAGDLLKDLSIGSGGTGKGALSGRTGGDGAKRASGATDASEAAVARALIWLSEHQYPDGSWSFEHTGGKCQGRCTDNGHLKDARFAATGMALLPFLGAGQTHKQGKYKEQVRAGLYWLSTNMVASRDAPNTGDMTGGGGAMYGHGIASIALCEAYAMTEDRQLAVPAQAALNFIMYAQDPVGGGWRYSPRTPGDTSVVGWQIMALKSGYLGRLHVTPTTVNGAKKFLDSVQGEGGAFYGYDRPPGQPPGPATSAVGLLCRMYLGWEHDKPELEKGVKHLASLGPQLGNMYFSYYATQVLHQFDGPDGDLWQSWNTKMRDSLIASQATEKHELGSWVLKGDHGYESGGRLYCTSMAAMTLEIYYRYMPIYTKKSAEDDFLE